MTQSQYFKPKTGHAIRWEIPSKHASILTNACEVPVTEDLSRHLQQAWASMEAMLVDAVCVELCKAGGKIENITALLVGVAQGRSFQGIVNKEIAPPFSHMRNPQPWHMRNSPP